MLLPRLMLISLLLYSVSSSAAIYKCTVNNKIVFTDQPCDQGESETVTLSHINRSSKVSHDMQTHERNYSSSTWYTGASGYRNATSIAEREQAPMLIYFYTDWCGYCTAFDRDTLAHADAKAATKPFVKVRINPEDDSHSKKIFKQFGGKGYPTFLVKPYQENPNKLVVTTTKGAISVERFAHKLKPYTPEPKPQTAEQYYQRSQQYMSENKQAEAIKDIKQAIVRKPKKFSYYEHLDDLLAEQKDWPQIIEYWDKYLILAPKDANAYLERAGAKKHNGNLAAAIDDALRASELGSAEGKRVHEMLSSSL